MSLQTERDARDVVLSGVNADRQEHLRQLTTYKRLAESRMKMQEELLVPLTQTLKSKEEALQDAEDLQVRHY